MEISSPEIDKKVCSGSHAQIDGDTATTYVKDIGKTGSENTKTTQCSGLKKDGSATTKGLAAFIVGVGLEDNKNWPRGRSGVNSNEPKMGETNSNAKAVAKDLVKELTPEEKTIVAGLLAKTIEGGEVVEIRAVFFHSVWCYKAVKDRELVLEFTISLYSEA
ncbi:putative major outer membrane protein P44-20 [Anaplasma phagocytophilum str. CRT53-1]|uniref:Putative major outer membrane protein P44-20 n=1 Tax=Anaplasma phagocytophilum str. CRT53-1 TaxID=1359157 RepID=A0A0F3Q4Y0_ANAPH|nr:putative major outer membrane protein P44-20 [Anaplasma phagocytophilum str. CRT53-1]